VTQDEWHQYGRLLAIEKRYPAIRRMGFAADGDGQGIAADVPNYFVSFSSGSIEKSDSPLDLNLADNSVLRVAAEQARETNSPTLSAPFPWRDRKVLLLIMPATLGQSSTDLSGWVYVFLDPDIAIASAIEEDRQLFDLRVNDGLIATTRSILFESGGSFLGPVDTKVVEIDGRKWTFRFVKSPDFDSQIAQVDPMWVLVGGLSISCLLFGMSWSIITARSRGTTLANQITEALRDREERLRAIVTNAPILLFALNRNGVFTQVEGSNLDVTGGQMGEVVGMSIFEVYGEQQQLLDAYSRALAGTADEAIAQIGRLTLDFRWSPLREVDGEVNGAIGVVTDITERQQLIVALQQSQAESKQRAEELEQTLKELASTQTQLIQNEKLSALGQLVAGVAHEINNPINFISGNIDYANNYVRDLLELLALYQQEFPDPGSVISAIIQELELDFLIEDLPQLLGSMKLGTDRIREIVLSLRTFSRVDKAEFTAVDLHEGINSTLLILNHKLKAKAHCPEIKLKKEFGVLPLVECYPGQLNQVFMNILANGIDAIEEYCRNASINPEIGIRTEVVEENRVAIHIIDNGPGIPEDVKNKLFDPYFTTKPPGKGTGLGLSISYQIIVEKHRGQLSCISTPGQGTEFVIEIPITQSN